MIIVKLGLLKRCLVKRIGLISLLFLLTACGGSSLPTAAPATEAPTLISPPTATCVLLGLEEQMSQIDVTLPSHLSGWASRLSELLARCRTRLRMTQILLGYDTSTFAECDRVEFSLRLRFCLKPAASVIPGTSRHVCFLRPVRSLPGWM
jgi:hypothetical protein